MTSAGVEDGANGLNAEDARGRHGLSSRLRLGGLRGRAATSRMEAVVSDKPATIADGSYGDNDGAGQDLDVIWDPVTG